MLQRPAQTNLFRVHPLTSALCQLELPPGDLQRAKMSAPPLSLPAFATIAHHLYGSFPITFRVIWLIEASMDREGRSLSSQPLLAGVCVSIVF